MPDYRAILKRYINNAFDDDYIVASRAAVDSSFTNDEKSALIEIAIEIGQETGDDFIVKCFREKHGQ